MKVWIDFSNSPHPLLFAPIVRGLEDGGHDVLLTARDNAQTVELARERFPEVEMIGGPSPKARRKKAATIAQRVRDLRAWARSRRPDVALSHNSYAQIVAAASLRIRVVTAMDFEHQPANHVAFRLANAILLPELFPLDQVLHQGGTASKIIRYPGFKEELYIGDFEPNGEVLRQLGIEMRPRTVVVARTPPTRATYHQFGNPIFSAAIELLGRREDSICVVLTRHPEQRAALATLDLPGCVVPDAAIDARSLVYAADAMIGAGGTMTREAALMGIPTWTVFAGRMPAVDAWLERRGQLARLTDPTQVSALGPRPTPPHEPWQLRERAGDIERVIVDATVGRQVRAMVQVR
jgi:hypothetical protein